MGTAQNTPWSNAHRTEEAAEAQGAEGTQVVTPPASAGSEPGPGSPQLTRRLGLATHLDALDALSDDIGVMHGHQRDLDASHPTHSGRPHSCGRGHSSALPPRARAASEGGVGGCHPPGRSHPGPHPANGWGQGAASWHWGAQGNATSPAQLTTQGVWMEPCSVSTAATLRTPKSSVRTWMPVTGQFSMTWEGEELLPKPGGALGGCRPPTL